MAYVKQTWATGDVVTATKLNNMESGIATGQSGIYPTTLELGVGIGESYNELVTELTTAGMVLLTATDNSTYEKRCMLIYLNGDASGGNYLAVFGGAGEYEFDATDPDDPMEQAP